jgi:hypothetical protein
MAFSGSYGVGVLCLMAAANRLAAKAVTPAANAVRVTVDAAIINMVIPDRANVVPRDFRAFLRLCDRKCNPSVTAK